MFTKLKETVNTYVEIEKSRLKQRTSHETTPTDSVSIEIDSLTKEEFNQLGMFSQMRALKNRTFIDRSRVSESFLVATLLFWYTVLSEIYTLSCWLIPALGESVGWANEPEWPAFWLYVGMVFMFVNVILNWAFTVYTPSFYAPAIDSEDQPDLYKNLWDDYDQALEAIQPAPKVPLEPIPPYKAKGKQSMIPCRPERNSGLQWRWCTACQRASPPRAHHCVICQKCALKRDHHCYMTGTCIGYRNQRYFFIMVFFSAWACGLGLWGNIRFLGEHFWAAGLWTSWLDIFFPVTIYRCVISKTIPGHICVMITQMYIFVLIFPMAVAFVGMQCFLIIKGITAQEFRRSSDIQSRLKIRQRIADVFGNYFLLNFVLPAQIMFQQTGDGVYWPGLYSMAGLKLLKDLPGYDRDDHNEIVVI